MALGGALLRSSQTLLRVLEFLCSGLILGVFSYYLAVLADHHLPISAWIKAVEGMAGGAVLYTLFAILLTFFLGGIAFFGLIAVLLDLCFVGCFAAIAYYTRHSANSCSGNVITPLGSGPSNSNAAGYGANGFGFGSGQNTTYRPNLRLACKLGTACFAVAIVNIFLFLLTAILQVLLVRHHKKEKRFGPSPSNNYTSGKAKKTPFWKRNRKSHDRGMINDEKHLNHDTEFAAIPTTGTGAGGVAHHNRLSHETGYTGTTVDNGVGHGSGEYRAPAPKHGSHESRLSGAHEPRLDTNEVAFSGNHVTRLGPPEARINAPDLRHLESGFGTTPYAHDHTTKDRY